MMSQLWDKRFCLGQCSCLRLLGLVLIFPCIPRFLMLVQVWLCFFRVSKRMSCGNIYYVIIFLSLNLNWYKSYDTKPKNAKNANLCFRTKSQKNGNGNICVLLHLRPYLLNQLRFRPIKHLKMTV